MIVRVDETNLSAAAEVYMLSWKDSHKDICSKEFIEKHNLEYMENFLHEKLNGGCKIYLNYSENKPLGIVGIAPDDEICLLYVLPNEQEKGCGSELLEYAIKLCEKPWLTVLETNLNAIKFYEKRGFIFDGEKDISSKKRISEYKYVYRGENM